MKVSDLTAFDSKLSLTPATLICLRESQNLTQADVAGLFDSDRKTVANWEQGRSVLSHPRCKAAIARLIEGAAQLELQLIEASGHPVTFRTDEGFWSAYPEFAGLPAGWHRAIAGRLITPGYIPDITFAD